MRFYNFINRLRNLVSTKHMDKPFVSGFASIAEIYPTMTVNDYGKALDRTLKVRRAASDADALKADWQRLNNDMKRAFGKLR